VDNIRTIDLIEKPGLSIFSLLEEECMVPKGTDSNFLSKIFTKLSSSALCQRNNREQTCFGIKHFAGEVQYESANFVEKNKDLVNPDIQKLFSNSQNKLLSDIFSPDNSFSAREISITKSSTSSNKSQQGQSNTMKGATLTSKFKLQLNELLDCLNDTNPSYIRCVKPNAVKKPLIFDSVDIMRQLKCAGILEAIRIRKNGYPVRRTHQDFLSKYGRISPELGKVGSNDTSKALFKKICSNPAAAKQLNGLWALGKTKVFMKEDALPILEQQLYLALQKYIKRMQNFARKIIMRKRWKKMSQIIRLKRRVVKIVFKTVLYKCKLHIVDKCSAKVAKNWKIYLANKKKLAMREKFMNIMVELKRQKIMSEITQGMELPPEEEKLSPKKSISPTKPREMDYSIDLSSYAPDVQQLIKKMQGELSELKRENSDLKMGGARGTITGRLSAVVKKVNSFLIL
jgi:myosin heavy subunit